MDVCLVTGGAGFIGSHLVKALVARGQKVRVLDNLSTGSLANLGRAVQDVEMVVGDVEDLDLVRELVAGVDVVFHLAATPPEEAPLGAPEFPCQCDLQTAHVLIASRDSQVRRVIYASTTQVYGHGPPGPPRSETDSVAPVSPFAIAKLSGEKSCTAFTLHSGLETVRLRYSNVYGPRQSPAMPHARFIPEALTALLAGDQPLLDGSGLEPLDLIFVEDVVEATLRAATAAVSPGRVFNVGRGRAAIAIEVVAVLNDLLDTGLLPVPTDRPLDEDFQNLVDSARARAELGFAPAVDLRTGLSRCVQAVAGAAFPGPHQNVKRFTEA
jgi:UDP-glucose 4-epimerase